GAQIQEHVRERSMKILRIAAVAGLLAAGVAASSLAQNLAAGAGYSGRITDTRTGKVWTPSWESLDAYQPTDPNHPVNREFDPRAPVASVPGMINQRPRASLLGMVPITAGPDMPVMMIDAPSLQAVPGERWISIL